MELPAMISATCTPLQPDVGHHLELGRQCSKHCFQFDPW